MSDASHSPTLQSLPGREPPPDLGADLARLARLPDAARAHLWEALGPSLSEPLPAPVEAQLDAFCAVHRVEGGELARALKACRFLIREASRVDLPLDAFVQDLAHLGAPAEIQRLLAAGYARAKVFVRGEWLRDALVQHGKLLLSAAYRVDTIQATSEARSLAAPVVLLTLRYREGKSEEQVTLQVLPETLRQLRDLCDQVLP
jgi:hypothetical protein